jgi:uncharacterized protein YceH (UPF0502 family)
MPRARFHKRRDPASGETVWVEGSELYSDWDLLETASRMPSRNEDYIGGKFVKDVKQEAKDERERKARGMSPTDILDRLEALEAQLAAMEAQLAKLIVHAR